MLIDLVTFTTFPWSTHITIPAIPHLGVLLRDHLVGGGLPRLDLAKIWRPCLDFWDQLSTLMGILCFHGVNRLLYGFHRC